MSAIAAAGIDLAGGVIQSIGAGRRARKQREWEEKQSKLQYQRSLADWHRQNQYNLPSNQMQRLRDAGLNPHLLYGTGTATAAGNATQMPAKTDRAKGSFANPFEPIAQRMANYNNWRLQNAQVNNTKESLKLIQSESLLKNAQAGTEVFKRLETLGRVRKDRATSRKLMYETDQIRKLLGGQVDALKLQNEKLTRDIQGADIDLKYRDEEKKLGVMNLQNEYQKGLRQLRLLSLEEAYRTYDNQIKKLEGTLAKDYGMFKDDTFEKITVRTAKDVSRQADGIAAQFMHWMQHSNTDAQAMSLLEEGWRLFTKYPKQFVDWYNKNYTSFDKAHGLNK